ncbi:hypothetical protein HDV00_002235 [Rhizophlyctis rosea]|nr:hypothetical protein HDV00_002235 [Rhizophlyctis rosea]
MPTSRTRFITVALLLISISSLFYLYNPTQSQQWIQDTRSSISSSSHSFYEQAAALAPNGRNSNTDKPKAYGSFRLKDEEGGANGGEENVAVYGGADAGAGAVKDGEVHAPQAPVIQSNKMAKGAQGEVIMAKMINETQKAELGRSSWRLLHTMAAKFPPSPSRDEQEAFLDFIYLFARLYPCGDCASHFQLVLQNHPPNVTSREGATQWACEAHNVVNERLGKPIFDCRDAAKAFGCGCGDEGKGGEGAAGSTGPSGDVAAAAGGAVGDEEEGEAGEEEEKGAAPDIGIKAVIGTPPTTPSSALPANVEPAPSPIEEPVEGGAPVAKIDASSSSIKKIQQLRLEEEVARRPPKDAADEAREKGLVRDVDEGEEGEEGDGGVVEGELAPKVGKDEEEVGKMGDGKGLVVEDVGVERGREEGDE